VRIEERQCPYVRRGRRPVGCLTGRGGRTHILAVCGRSQAPRCAVVLCPDRRTVRGCDGGARRDLTVRQADHRQRGVERQHAQDGKTQPANPDHVVVERRIGEFVGRVNLRSATDESPSPVESRLDPSTRPSTWRSFSLRRRIRATAASCTARVAGAAMTGCSRARRARPRGDRGPSRASDPSTGTRTTGSRGGTGRAVPA
jgi:hypothetical protein